MKLILSFLVGSALFAGSAEARVIPEVRQFVAGEVAKQALVVEQRKLEGKEQKLAFAQAADSSYTMSMFALRIKGEFGFDIDVVNLKVVPTVEFFWLP